MTTRAEIPNDVLDSLGGPEAPPVVVAVSGGPDSVALTLLLDDARRAGKAPRLHLAHLNHRIRGAAAERDAEFVRGLAGKIAAASTVEACDVPAQSARWKLSVEHAARECRYEFLERVARETGARWVATGHTADDQIETVLHNILRGAGIHGLAGMPRTRPLSPTSDARIIRPLLDVTHRDLVEFLRARGEDSCTDQTNLDTAYTRNRIRHVLIPALESDWPTLRADVSDFARELGELDGLLESRAADWLATSGEANLASLQSLDEPLASYVVRALIARVLGDLRRIDEVHVRMILELIDSGATGSSLDLPRGLIVRRDYEALRFETRAAPPPRMPPRVEAAPSAAPVFDEVLLPAPGSVRWGEWELRTEVLDVRGIGMGMRTFIDELKRTDPASVQYLDVDRLGSGQWTVRARRPGDRFTPLGAPGQTKLKDFLIRRKVPHAERDGLPLVVADGRIAAIATLAVSDDAALTEDTTRVLKLLWGTDRPVCPGR